MNYSSIPTVTGSSLRRSETNNLVETHANPFSFMSQDDGKETASLRMIRNFTYNCTEKTNQRVKDQLDFGNIIQQNDLIKYAEQQWGQEIEVEKIKLIFSDKAYASYFNYSFLTHMLNVKYDSQLTTEKILIQSRLILRKATRGGPREQGPRSVQQRVATSAEKIGFNYGLDEDVLYAHRLETAENQAQHQEDIQQQLSGAMLAILHAHAMHIESRMMNILPMDYGARWTLKGMGNNMKPVTELYKYQREAFHHAVHATNGPFRFDHLSNTIARETKGDYDAVILSTLPIYYGNVNNAIAVPSLPYLIARDIDADNEQDIKDKIGLSRDQRYKPSMGVIGSDPKTTSGVDTNMTSVLGKGTQRYIRQKTFATPNLTFIEDIKRPNLESYHHEDTHMNADNPLKMYMLRIDYEQLVKGELSMKKEETEVGIRVRTNSNSPNAIEGSIPPITKFGNLYLNINQRTGDFFQPQINQPGDTRSVDLHAEVGFQPRNMESMSRRFTALLCPVHDLDENVKHDLSVGLPLGIEKIIPYTGPTTDRDEANVDYHMEHEASVIFNDTTIDPPRCNILAKVPIYMYKLTLTDQKLRDIFLKEVFAFPGQSNFKTNDKYFFFQFKSILKNTRFGKANSNSSFEEIQQAPKYNEKLQTMMADDPVYRRLNMKAAGSYSVPVTDKEAAHLLFKASVYYHFISKEFKSWGDWGTVKFEIEYPLYENVSSKRSLGEELDSNEAKTAYDRIEKEIGEIEEEEIVRDNQLEKIQRLKFLGSQLNSLNYNENDKKDLIDRIEKRLETLISDYDTKKTTSRKSS